MSQPPSTPVKVPASATTYTPATLDPDLRSQINSILLREGHITKMQETLLHALDADASNWPSSIQQHALTLLRSGEVSTFPSLISRVLDDIRQETSASTAKGSDSNKNGEANGTANGDNKKAVNGEGAHGSGNLAVPPTVVDAVLRVARESLENVCEADDSSGTATSN